jgi:cyclic beta-1,2-glucan synthetase
MQKEKLEGDDHLIQLVSQKINDLNEKYPGKTGYIFSFPSSAKMESKDRVWMGYERKRGKLSDLNSLLRGGPELFSVIIGNTQF